MASPVQVKAAASRQNCPNTCSQFRLEAWISLHFSAANALYTNKAQFYESRPMIETSNPISKIQFVSIKTPQRGEEWNARFCALDHHNSRTNCGCPTNSSKTTSFKGLEMDLKNHDRSGQTLGHIKSKLFNCV